MCLRTIYDYLVLENSKEPKLLELDKKIDKILEDYNEYEYQNYFD